MSGVKFFEKLIINSFHYFVILGRMQTKRELTLNIRKRHVMRKEGLQNLTLTGWTEGKRDKGKEHITYLSKWMAELGPGEITKSQSLLRSTKEMESHDRLYPEGRRHTKEEEDQIP